MKLAKAREIGKVCGLHTDAECILNIDLHAISLFSYANLEKELNELKADCLANGIDYDQILIDADRRFNKQLENKEID